MPRGEGPPVSVRCPRHRWPEAWLELSSRKIAFTTTRSSSFDIDRGGGHVDVLLPAAAVGLVAHIVTRLETAPNPWPGRLRARQGRDLWAQLGDEGQLPNPPADWIDPDEDPLAAAVVEALEASA